MKKYLFIIALILTMMNSCKKLPDLGGGYRLDYSGKSNYAQIEYFDNSVIVGDDIMNYSFDNNFIIVEQKPIDTILNQSLKDNIDWEAAIKNSTLRQYWIVVKNLKPVFDEKNKRHTNVYGPLKKSEYLKQLKQLNVPTDLKLKGE